MELGRLLVHSNMLVPQFPVCWSLLVHNKKNTKIDLNLKFEKLINAFMENENRVAFSSFLFWKKNSSITTGFATTHRNELYWLHNHFLTCITMSERIYKKLNCIHFLTTTRADRNVPGLFELLAYGASERDAVCSISCTDISRLQMFL